MSQVVDPHSGPASHESIHPDPGEISVSFSDGATLVTLSGEIDLAAAKDLDDAGRDVIDRGVPVRIDMRRLTFIDSIGIGFIARMVGAAHESGERVTVVGASQRIVEGLTLVGLSSLLDYR